MSNDMLTAARDLRPALTWCIDDEGNASGDNGELTFTVYSFGGGACMAIAQAGCFVIATSRADALSEALDDLDQQIAQRAADPGSMLVVLRSIKGGME